MIFWVNLIFPTRKLPHKANFTKIIYLSVQIKLDKKIHWPLKYNCPVSLQTLYPVFYDIIEMNNAKSSGKAGFELTETQSEQQKRASKKALNLNGGNDEARTRDLMRDRHAL